MSWFLHLEHLDFTEVSDLLIAFISDVCQRSKVTAAQHYDDVIMGAIASQITSLTIVFSFVYLDTDQRKHQSSASLAFVRGTGGRWIPRTNGQWRGNVSIWWRHHGKTKPVSRIRFPDCKVRGACMGPTWDRQDPGGPHVGPMNLAIRVVHRYLCNLLHIHYGIWCWSLLALEWTIIVSLYSIVGVGVTGPPQSTNWSGRVLQAISSVTYIAEPDKNLNGFLQYI